MRAAAAPRRHLVAGVVGVGAAPDPRSLPDGTAVDRWQPAYIGVGSNLDEPRRQVQSAFLRLARVPDTRLILTSGMYASKPFGPVVQPDFVNAAAAVLTQLTARQFLDALRAIESDMGRPAQHEHWGPRVIDLDLLSYARERSSDGQLTLPHPGIVERNFVLYPLAQITPDLELPGLGRVEELKGRVTSEGLSLL
jgi:2-amino-4-hydroxy-6-hydroxymethyldihydropteridine diphosphokinase